MSIKIGRSAVDKKCYIIAEFGSNCWPYTYEKFDKLLWAARYADADAVKVQLFWSKHFPREEQAGKLPYVFPRGKLKWLRDRARSMGLGIGASVFDEGAVDLVTDLGLDFLKLATREQYNIDLRRYANRRFHGTIIRSVSYPPGYQVNRMPREVTLGCIPRYPTRKPHWHWLHDVNISLPHPWGWSSHTLLFEDCLIAVVKGASVIEKHLYYSENDPEYRWSMPASHFAFMVRMIRLYEQGVKLSGLEDEYRESIRILKSAELGYRRNAMAADELIHELEARRYE